MEFAGGLAYIRTYIHTYIYTWVTVVFFLPFCGGVDARILWWNATLVTSWVLNSQ